MITQGMSLLNGVFLSFFIEAQVLQSIVPESDIIFDVVGHDDHDSGHICFWNDAQVGRHQADSSIVSSERNRMMFL